MSRRKYERYFSPISREPFSTAGTHRNQGRVGQTSLSRSLARTTMIPRTAVPTGNGGHYGQYAVNVVGSCCKSSHSDGQTSMTSKGVILSRVTNPTAVYNTACDKPGACNKPTVKNFDPAVHSGEMLIRRVRAKNMFENWDKLSGDVSLYEGYKYKCNSCGPGGTPAEHYIGTRKFTNEPYAKRMAPMDISEYLRTQYLSKNATERPCPCPPPKPPVSGAISNDDPPSYPYNDDPPAGQNPNDDPPAGQNPNVTGSS